MMIEFLPPKFIINVIRKIQEQPSRYSVESDFLLRAIRIKNTTGKTIQIRRCVFDLKIKGRSQQQILYPEEILRARIRALSEFAEKFLNKRNGYGDIFRKGTLHALFGTDRFWDKHRLSNTTILEPDQETGFINEHFRIVTSDPIDELVSIIFFNEEDKEKKTQVSIPVIEYSNKNQYIFPVKGVWRVKGNWDSPESHRMAYSQEFAFDLDQLDSNLQVVLSQEQPNEEHASYGKEVIAVADGEVVECFDQLPENPSSCTDLPDEQIIKFAQKYGYVRTSGGNQVILKHSNGEYSFYAHLIPNSLKVRKGEKVKKGQVLGRVGNSGNSEGPHLHFQLMDGPDKATARGLPCYFTNIKNCQGDPVKLIDRDGSIIHTINDNS